VNFIKCPC